MYLRHRYMTFVDDQQEIVGEIVDKTEGTRAGRTSVEIARIIFDTAAVAHLANHLKVVVDTLLKAPGFEVAAFGVELVATLEHIVLYLKKSVVDTLLGGEEVAGRINHNLVLGFHTVAGKRVESLETLYLVVPKGDTITEIGVGGEHIHGVAFHTETAVGKLYLVARIERVHEL